MTTGSTASSPDLSPAEKLAWVRLARAENVGPVTFHHLLSLYKTASAALEALPERAAKGGLGRKITIPSLQTIEQELAATRHSGACIIMHCEADYPASLRQLADAPPTLTVQGDGALLHKPMVALVGARNASLNGRRMAEKLARDLGDAGYIVVSGLAAGIDAAAHQGSLKTGTVGVVAGGIDQIYPPENTALFEKMRAQGAIVAEMPFSTPINARLFPRRNRLVSGLAQAVVVVEAALKSGSLITARMAAEQGREVMAVPGSPLDPRAQGANRLIKDGAALIETVDDVLAQLQHLNTLKGMAEPVSPPYSPAPPDEAELDRLRPQVLEALSYTPVQVDEIIRLCQCAPSALLAILLELELAGRITRHAGHQVALVAYERAVGEE